MEVNIKVGRLEALYSHEKPTVSINQTGTDQNGQHEYTVDLGIPSGRIGVGSNELRLGNWVKYIPKGRVEEALHSGRSDLYQVTCVGGGDKITPLPQLYLQGAGGYLSLHDFDSVAPIPLTEELILRCGFESYYDDKYDPNDEYAEGFEYRLEVGIFHRALVCWPFKGWCAYIEQSQTKVEYLHQLQNLYFSLTGEELDVKL